MAWRIDEAVIRGEIDNTIDGRVTGRIWLVGRDEPLVLALVGNCWRDLAGTRLSFQNPDPKRGEDADALELDQTGVVGDMTASRKSKVPSVGDEEFRALYEGKKEIPFEWRNTLYLEWFSEINGRVVVETTDFQLRVSPHEWQMDADDEEAQKLANLTSMRDFMTQVIRRRDPDAADRGLAGELDEFAWEERLKESDRLTDAYQEVLEKYMEDEDSERKEAFVMGWDGLLDALADRDEADPENGGDASENFELPDDFEDGEDGDDSAFLAEDDEDADGETHPLQSQAQELAMRAMDLVSRDDGPGTPSYRLISNLLQVSGKLAGALNGRGSGYEPETGFVLAVLKRCMSWLNDAVGASQELMDAETDPDQRAALENLRANTFQVRDEIVELRRELKQS